MEGGDQNMLSTRVVHFRSQHRGVTDKDAGHHTRTETEQWERNRTGSPEKDKLRGQGGLGELAGRALRGSWNRRPNRPWWGWGECPTPIAQPETREWGAVLNMATHAVHGRWDRMRGRAWSGASDVMETRLTLFAGPRKPLEGWPGWCGFCNPSDLQRWDEGQQDQLTGVGVKLGGHFWEGPMRARPKREGRLEETVKGEQEDLDHRKKSTPEIPWSTAARLCRGGQVYLQVQVPCQGCELPRMRGKSVPRLAATWRGW